MTSTHPIQSPDELSEGPLIDELTLDHACEAWSDLLGESHVLRSSAALRQYRRTTLPDAPAPVAVLQPQSMDQLPAIVRIASTHQIPLYPISRGKNWGWGDACPTTEGQVILDLSALDRIVEVNEELGYAVVQPGVTQGQLAAYLSARHSTWRLDWTGAGPDTSLLGNLLERGITVDERVSRAMGMQVLLADGSIVRTGYGHYPASRVTHVARWGIGPALDGLFSQSNLGIVTEIGFWLLPKPAHVEVGFYTIPDNDVQDAVDVLRRLRIRGLLTALPIQLLRGRDGTPTWGGILPVEGSPGTVAAQREELTEILSPVANIVFPRPGEVSTVEGQAAILTRLDLPVTPLLRAIISQGDFDKGLQPTPEALLMFLGGPEVQHPTEPPASVNPLDHDYGFYFLWLTCPALGRDVRALLDLVRSALAAHGFPPLFSLRFTNGRAVVLVMRIAFDRKDEERRGAARACKQAVLDAAIAAGYPPARVPSDAMNRLDPHGDNYWRLVRRIKCAMDPENILAPGRYLPPMNGNGASDV